MKLHSSGDDTIQDRLDWMAGLVEQDITALALIVGGWKIGFRLDGADLDQAVRRSLMLMLEHGACPIQGANDGEFHWNRITRFGDDPAGIVDGVIAEWTAAGVDPDIGAVWFGSPRLIAIECRS